MLGIIVFGQSVSESNDRSQLSAKYEIAQAAAVRAARQQQGVGIVGIARGLSIEDARNRSFDLGIGEYFGVKFPTHWAEDDMYGFNWSELRKDKEPTQTLW